MGHDFMSMTANFMRDREYSAKQIRGALAPICDHSLLAFAYFAYGDFPTIPPARSEVMSVEKIFWSKAHVQRRWCVRVL